MMEGYIGIYIRVLLIVTTRLSANKIKVINSFTALAYRIHDALNIYYSIFVLRQYILFYT